MKNNTTELVFIIDKSGSMHSLVSDTLGGFNSMLKRQKALDKPAYVTTVFFDTVITRVHDRMKLASVPFLTEDDYIPGGCTALYNTIGSTVEHIDNVHKYARPEDVPDATIFVIITDGMDNSSHKFSSLQIKSMISRKQEEAGWEFICLGANIDAFDEAESLGIGRENAANFHPDTAGMTKVFNAVSCAVSHARCAKPLPADWKEEVEADFLGR